MHTRAREDEPDAVGTDAEHVHTDGRSKQAVGAVESHHHLTPISTGKAGSLTRMRRTSPANRPDRT